MRTRMIAATLIALAAALLTACSNNDDSSAEAGFNSADVTFATDMIPHHRQATEMAALAASRTENAEVLDLADRIGAAQDPEIDTMSSWLESWGEDVPEDMSGMDDMSSMPGMMSGDQMSRLRDSSGEAFDQLFLTMMVEHHEGAVEMAQTEQTDGMSTDAVSLATEIEQTQTAEITEMMKLLAS
ncbi:DUF305 domain-containing protein [Aeromicrobium sp. CF3.5]|uniref:DUF305 domain-containing protein n=1 Tax=Aeromicrobium sp. CF3.5 TaxID=3373078 RepID=UPI003EE8185D